MTCDILRQNRGCLKSRIGSLLSPSALCVRIYSDSHELALGVHKHLLDDASSPVDSSQLQTEKRPSNCSLHKNKFSKLCLKCEQSQVLQVPLERYCVRFNTKWRPYSRMRVGLLHSVKYKQMQSLSSEPSEVQSQGLFPMCARFSAGGPSLRRLSRPQLRNVPQQWLLFEMPARTHCISQAQKMRSVSSQLRPLLIRVDLPQMRDRLRLECGVDLRAPLRARLLYSRPRIQAMRLLRPVPIVHDSRQLALLVMPRLRAALRVLLREAIFLEFRVVIAECTFSSRCPCQLHPESELPGQHLDPPASNRLRVPTRRRGGTPTPGSAACPAPFFRGLFADQRCLSGLSDPVLRVLFLELQSPICPHGSQIHRISGRFGGSSGLDEPGRFLQFELDCVFFELE